MPDEYMPDTRMHAVSNLDKKETLLTIPESTKIIDQYFSIIQGSININANISELLETVKFPVIHEAYLTIYNHSAATLYLYDTTKGDIVKDNMQIATIPPKSYICVPMLNIHGQAKILYDNGTANTYKIMYTVTPHNTLVHIQYV